jgi:hypothetical protein
MGNGFAITEARLILATVAQYYKLFLDPCETIGPFS